MSHREIVVLVSSYTFAGHLLSHAVSEALQVHYGLRGHRRNRRGRSRVVQTHSLQLLRNRSDGYVDELCFALAVVGGRAPQQVLPRASARQQGAFVLLQRKKPRTGRHENYGKRERDVVRKYVLRHVPQYMLQMQLHATFLQRVRDDMKHCVCLGNMIGKYHITFWTISRLVGLTVRCRKRLVDIYHNAALYVTRGVVALYTRCFSI